MNEEEKGRSVKKILESPKLKTPEDEREDKNYHQNQHNIMSE